MLLNSFTWFGLPQNTEKLPLAQHVIHKSYSFNKTTLGSNLLAIVEATLLCHMSCPALPQARLKHLVTLNIFHLSWLIDLKHLVDTTFEHFVN